MKHILNYNTFLLEKLEIISNKNDRFEIIVEQIETELKNQGVYDDLYNIIKSETRFGQSWYLIFSNKLEIRISDHSVTSTQRVLDNKYVAFLYYDKKYTNDEIKKIVDYYISMKNNLIKKAEERKKIFDEQKLEDELIIKNSSEFIEKLKSENKAIFTSNKTYQTLEEFISKHPDIEFVCQTKCQNAYEYFYVKKQNGYGRYSLTSYKEYYKWLVDNNVIKKLLNI